MFEYRPVPKNTKSKRVKPTQKQLGDISDKVRKEVAERSGGVCELCKMQRAIQQAHIIGRKQLKVKTTADNLLHVCVECHMWLDSTPEGIAYKNKLKGE